MATTTKNSVKQRPNSEADGIAIAPKLPPTNGNQVTAPATIKFTYPAKKELSTKGTIKVLLSSLVSLDATSIPNAEAAMRELDENNVYALIKAYEAEKPVPLILVQQSNEGNILVGGYHRRAAMLSMAAEQGIDPALMEIEVTPTSFTTARAVLNAAYIDNFNNGLGMSANSRSRYALQLMAWDAEDGYPNGKPLSLHKAADIAGCSHVAVLKMRDKLAGKTKTQKMVDTLLSPEDQAEVEAYHISKTATTEATQNDPTVALNKAAKQMFTSLSQVFALNSNVNELAILFRNYIGKDDEKAVTAVSLAMQAVTMNRTFGQKPGTTK